MTSVAAPDTGTQSSAADGRGPQGMWWVAFRQHRPLLVAIGAIVLVLAAAMLHFRFGLTGDLRAAAGANYDACRQTTDIYATGSPCSVDAQYVIASYAGWWFGGVGALMVFGPIAVGAIAGVSLFAVEFDRRTAVFALTQSVGRLRWWVSPLVVVGAALVVSMLVLGFLRGWADDPFANFVGPPYETVSFAGISVIPAALAVVGLSIGSTAGVVCRSPLPALVATLAVTAAVLVPLSYETPHLIPADRQVASLQARSTLYGAPQMPPGAYYLKSGFSTADGRETWFAECETAGNAEAMELDEDAQNRIQIACLTDRGFTSFFTDYLDPDHIGELRAVFSVVCAAIAAAFFALGAVVLRRRAVR